jgi:diguanylate cyclase (GGDEF)-like protein
VRLPRLSRTEAVDGTHRFTTAWVLALTAVGLLVISGSLLAQDALDEQGRLVEAVEAAASVDDQQVLAAELIRTVRDTGDGSADELGELLAAFRDGHADVETLVGRHGLSWAGATVARDITAGVQRITDDPSASPGLREEVVADLWTYDGELRRVEGALLDPGSDGLGDLSDTRTTLQSILVATLLLLLVEAFLVFRPATRRIRQTLELRRKQAEDERLRTQKQLEMLARYDHLTGLANRMMFRDRLEHAVASAPRTGKQVALMFLDLDKFKDVNDQLGHDAGDEVLIEVAERLQEVARRTDTIARIGGDEFTVILEGLDGPDGAASVASKLLQSLGMPIEVGDHELQVTASVGIAMFPTDATDTDTLIRHADTAMYHAKAEGRNTFAFSTSDLREASLARLKMIQDLRTAVEEGRLRLLYQPQVDLRSDRIVGVEALVRWLRPDGEEVAAKDFIELAEDTDLMVPLGDWVLREACGQAVRWRDEGLGELRIAVNVSGRQFRQPNLATAIATALNETGLDATQLELEITEGSLVEDVEASAVTLRLLKGIGVRIALDDFGTGYSSLGYLKQFPIDALKIDDSFMREVTDASEPDADVVPAAIAGLAQHLGMEAIAEGIEDEAQLRLVRRIGVDRAQGFHLWPPMDGTDLAALLRRRRMGALRDVSDEGVS